MKHWMFNCKKVTQLLSESLDRNLPLYERMGIRIHLMMCKFCSRYKEQLLFLRKTARLYSESSEDSDLSIQLSPEVGKRIKESMAPFLEKHE
ncbi:MAG: zf-HC2 domain-containing protein [Desulfobacterales bacterium]